MSIRFATQQDIPQILSIYGPYVQNTAISFEYTVPTMAEFTQRFSAITAQFPWLVWEQEGRVLGYAYGGAPFERAAFGWCAEASIYLDPQAQGQGIGKALYRALEILLTLQGYIKVYTLITTANAPSLRFHEAVGYRYTAIMPDCGFKLDAWHGVVWMEKTLNFVEKPTDFPVPIHSVVENDGKLNEILDKMPLSS